MEFGAALIFAIITFLMMIFFIMLGIYLVKGGIRGFKKLKIEGKQRNEKNKIRLSSFKFPMLFNIFTNFY
jgi:predicted membrane protein